MNLVLSGPKRRYMNYNEVKWWIRGISDRKRGQGGRQSQTMWDPAKVRNLDVILGMMGNHWRVVHRQMT